MIRKTLKALALGAALALMPVAAYAVNVSDGDGFGEQHLVTRYSNGAQVTGSLTSTRSYIYVYYAGLVDWGHWWCSNMDVGRYTSNTNRLSAVGRGGTFGYWPPCSGSGTSTTRVASKVCRDITAWPDSCGPWSSLY
jgi:hypothetical protein